MTHQDALSNPHAALVSNLDQGSQPSDYCIDYPALSTTLDYLIHYILGDAVEQAVLAQLTQDQKVLNALFDLIETIHDNRAFSSDSESRVRHLALSQSLLATILRKGRIVNHYFSGVDSNEPDITDGILSQPDYIQSSNNPYDVTDETQLIEQGVAQAEISAFKQQGDWFDGDQLNCDQLVLDQDNHPFNSIAQQLDHLVTSNIVSGADSDKIELSDEIEHNEIKRKIASSDDINADVLLIQQSQEQLSGAEQSAASNLISQVIKMPHFQIPNGRVGQAYQAQIKPQMTVIEPVDIDTSSVTLPATLGLVYDISAQHLIGTPTTAGEFQVLFNYKRSDGAWHEGSCTLIITADPRSLWQVNEPAEGQPYAKVHSDHRLISNPHYQLAAASRRGRSHEHAGNFRDDDFFIHTIENTAWSIMLVADGAGSAAFSREGSRIAVQTAGQILVDYLAENYQQLDEQLTQWHIGATDDQTKTVSQLVHNSFYALYYKAAQQAIQSIEEVAHAEVVSSKAFATTLLAAVVRQEANKTFVTTLWVGDGAIAVYSPQKLRLMGKPDSGEFAGQTRFLDKSIVSTFNDRVNIGYFEHAHAVVLMTDGISDPKFETDAGLQNQQKWDLLWHELQPVLQHEVVDDALLEWMHFFRAGHHDDRTLAILWPEQSKSRELEPALEKSCSTAIASAQTGDYLKLPDDLASADKDNS